MTRRPWWDDGFHLVVNEEIRSFWEHFKEHRMSISEHLEAWWNEIEGVTGFYHAHAPAIHSMVTTAYSMLASMQALHLVNMAAYPTLAAWLAFAATVFGVTGIALIPHSRTVQATQRLAREMHTMLSDVEITGDRNTGNRNTGNRNTGNWNTGDLNTGDLNTGDCNTGNCNTGNCNTGDCNTGDRNTGFFCTETPSPTFFDTPWTGGTHEQARELVPYVELSVGAAWTPTEKMTDAEKKANPNHTTIGGFLQAQTLTIQQAFPLAWAKMDEATKQRFLDLPNFDAEKFLACTGVDVRKPTVEIVVDGVKYRRVE
jgi:hypothetical protein